MKTLRNRILSVLLVPAVILMNISFVSPADELDETIAAMQQEEARTQETISNLEKETQETKNAISALESEREATESTVVDLKNQSSVLKSTINGYTGQLNELSEQIEEAEEALAETSSEIVALNSELSDLRSEKEECYRLLKMRIKAAYENGGTEGMVLRVLQSASIGEFLNKADYMKAVVEYDRRKLAEYQALEEQLVLKTAAVEEREEELNAYQDTLDEKHSELADLTDTVRGQLDSTYNSINTEKGKLADYDRQLADLDKKMKSLESRVAAAQADLARQIAERLSLTREDTSGSYAASASELEWLAATIQAEAGGESYTGKLAVGSVIMNRVKSSAFPNTIVGVITQNMQFASYRSGKVELIISRGPNSACIQAAQEVLNGARVGDYLFFMTQYFADYYGISEYTMIGHHAFFYRWVTNKKEKEPEEEEDYEEPAPEKPEEEENMPPEEEVEKPEEPEDDQPSGDDTGSEDTGDTDQGEEYVDTDDPVDD
ncbi:MAG: cell wall hydrolase [Lachnospiraceae bacterium]|nr:cell wall hydrolase [Lachnospiraceae bacterium]